MREDHGPYTNSGGQGVGPHNSRVTSCERMHPNLGGQDGVVAVSLVLSRPVPWSQSELSAGWRRASGYRCTTPAG